MPISAEDGSTLYEPPISNEHGEYGTKPPRLDRKPLRERLIPPLVIGLGVLSLILLPNDDWPSATGPTGDQRAAPGAAPVPIGRQISDKEARAFKVLEDACYANPTVIATGAEIHIPPSSDSVRVMGAGARVILDEGVDAGDVTVCGARARILLEDSSTAGIVAIFGAGVEAHIRPGAEAMKVIAEGSNATVFAGTTDIQLVVNGDGSGVSSIG